MDVVALLLNLLVLIVILCLVYAIVRLAIQATGFPIDLRLVQIILLLIVLLWFVGYFAGSIPRWPVTVR